MAAMMAVIRSLDTIHMTNIEITEILNTYKSNVSIEYDLVIEILQTLESRSDYFISNVGISPIIEFVYWQTHRFNRFSVPTPFVLEAESKALFNRYLTLLKRLETSNINTACLLIDSLCWDAFDIIESGNETEKLPSIIKSIKQIKAPNHPDKIEEFNSHKKN